jgi:hypothetical protein
LTNAAVVKQSDVLHADGAEIAQARHAALGVETYRLAGTADFSPIGALLATGQRALFTSEASANTTGALLPGHKVAVKALMIPGAPATLNLVSVQPAADSCH